MSNKTGMELMDNARIGLSSVTNRDFRLGYTYETAPFYCIDLDMDLMCDSVGTGSNLQSVGVISAGGNQYYSLDWGFDRFEIVGQRYDSSNYPVSWTTAESDNNVICTAVMKDGLLPSIVSTYEYCITQEQFATILYRYAVNKGYDVSVGEETNLLSYVDAEEIDSWAVDAMQWAVGAGLFEGKGKNNLDPTGKATRAEMAAILFVSART